MKKIDAQKAKTKSRNERQRTSSAVDSVQIQPTSGNGGDESSLPAVHNRCKLPTKQLPETSAVGRRRNNLPALYGYDLKLESWTQGLSFWNETPAAEVLLMSVACKIDPMSCSAEAAQTMVVR